MTDGESVRRAMQGDAVALSGLARGWSARLFAFCLARCRNRHLAEDIAQEALLRALRNLHTLEDPDRFGPWLRGIALRVYLDWRKARQTSQVPFSTLQSDEAVDDLLARDAAPGYDREDELHRLMREVATLDDDQRETLMLYYSHEMTYAELAELLEVSPATINVRLTKARAILRSRLKPSDATGETTVRDGSAALNDPAALSDSAALNDSAALSESAAGVARRRP